MTFTPEEIAAAEKSAAAKWMTDNIELVRWAVPRKTADELESLAHAALREAGEHRIVCDLCGPLKEEFNCVQNFKAGSLCGPCTEAAVAAAIADKGAPDA